MTWQTAKLVSETLAILVLAGTAVYVAHDLHRTQEEIRSAIANLGATEQSAKDLLVAVNRPCGSGEPCGLLAEAGKTMVKVQDISVTTQRQVAQSSKLVDAASQSLTQTSQSIATVAAALPPVALQATSTLKSAQSAINDLLPLEQEIAQDSVALHRAITDTDSLISSPDVRDTISNVQSTTKEFSLISNDLHVWTHPILNPDPCQNAKCKWGRALAKVGGYLSIGAQAETFGTFWKPLPVSIRK